MTAVNIKNIAATAAVAGSLSLAALGLGTAVAAATPSTAPGSSTGTSSAATGHTAHRSVKSGKTANGIATEAPTSQFKPLKSLIPGYGNGKFNTGRGEFIYIPNAATMQTLQNNLSQQSGIPPIQISAAQTAVISQARNNIKG